MTFLEICRQARLEASIAGDGPVSVVGTQTKELSRIINWVKQEWRLLQGQRTWSWQWENPTLTVLAHSNVSSVAQSIAPVRWDKEAAFLGTMQMDFFPWEQFRLRYPFSQITVGQPIAWSIRPDLAFVVNAKPTVDTDIAVERYANPVDLVNDTDVPGMPEDLHEYLVWTAVMKYAARDEAGSLYSTAEKFANDLKASLMERCLPQISLGGALA